jgi:hypothetical protein
MHPEKLSNATVKNEDTLKAPDTTSAGRRGRP